MSRADTVPALVIGLVSVVESRGRSWAGWGVICLAAYHLWGVVT